MSSSGSPKFNRLALILEMLEEQPNDAFLIYAAALEHQKSENHHAAIALLEKLKTEQPTYLATYYQLAKLYETVGSADKAIETYTIGKKIAQQQGEFKTAAEISEALNQLTDDY